MMKKSQQLLLVLFFDYFQRGKRQIESAHNLAEDGTPIVVGNSYTGNDAQNTEGLRIYDAWFQHRNNHEIPQKQQIFAEPPKAGGESIQPHHR